MKKTPNDETKLFVSVKWIAYKIHQVCSYINTIPRKCPEFLATTLYAVLHLVMAIFHEPWYDEAVAWQIARCASIKDILFEIPHYEGHPPLWHLILLPFAKLGAPYELTLTLVSLTFAGAAISLIIWRSPFPRIIRLLLPFTYFFFYQYGVISRPYCVMMLAFILLAITYRYKNEKPEKYTLSLILLCLTSAYGIVIAGGLAIVWVLEIWNRQNLFSFIKTFINDKRIWWLIILLILALLLIVEIFPREDTFATNLLNDKKEKNSFFICVLYMLFGSVVDVGLTSLYSSYNCLQLIHFDMFSLVGTCFLGAILWISALLLGYKKHTALTLLIPYGTYAVFAALIYISPHHIGVGLLILVFWLWISLQSNDCNELIKLSQHDKQLISNINVIFFTVVIIVSLSWNILSCIKDISYIYAAGRQEAKFIAEHELDQYQIMVGWDVLYDDNNNIIEMDINHCRAADNVAPYFENNIFFNFNDGSDKINYSTHKKASKEETLKSIKKWNQIIPDVLFMNPELKAIYDDKVNLKEYTLVYSKINRKIWKGESNYSRSSIYVKNDIAEEIGLEKVDVDRLPWSIF